MISSRLARPRGSSAAQAAASPRGGRSSRHRSSTATRGGTMRTMIGAGETPRALSIGVWPGSAGRRGRRILALVGAGALLAALALPWFPGTGIAEAQARPATWDVQAGGGDQARGLSLNPLFPDPLAIH